MKKITKILSTRINLVLISLALGGCAASGDKRAMEDVGPVTAYARNSLAAENPEGLLRIGEGFERSGDFVGARKLYAQARAVAPDLLEAHIAYARASGLAGFSDEAVAILTVIGRENPQNKKIAVTLSKIHAAVGRYQAAFDGLQKINEPSHDALVLKGKLAHVLGDGEAGQRSLVAALDMQPDDPQVLEAAALSFALNEDYASAVGLLRRAMDSRTGSPTAQNSLAQVYALSGQREAALRLARDVLPAHEVQRLESFFRLLPRFGKQDQAAALFFNRVPREAIGRLSGRATN